MLSWTSKVLNLAFHSEDKMKITGFNVYHERNKQDFYETQETVAQTTGVKFKDLSHIILYHVQNNNFNKKTDWITVSLIINEENEE